MKRPKRKKLWLLRCIGEEWYDIVESDDVPWLTEDEAGQWSVRPSDGFVHSLFLTARATTRSAMRTGSSLAAIGTASCGARRSDET